MNNQNLATAKKNLDKSEKIHKSEIINSNVKPNVINADKSPEDDYDRLFWLVPMLYD